MSEHPIAARWRALGDRGRRGGALIPYVTAGFPTPAVSRDALRAVVAAGADFVEVGVPFSDPLADGPTIQRSTQAALDQGMTAAGVLTLIREAALAVPVIIMTYLNPVLAYGVERFVADAHTAGAAGLLLTDLPAGAEVTPDLMRRRRWIPRRELAVKVLGEGEMKAALTVRAHRFSRAAVAKIEAAGGRVEILPVRRKGPAAPRLDRRAQRRAAARQSGGGAAR